MVLMVLFYILIDLYFCLFIDFQIKKGTIGHVAHGKSTIVKAISGVQVIFLFKIKKFHRSS